MCAATPRPRERAGPLPGATPAALRAEDPRVTDIHRQLFEATPDGVVVIDDTGTLVLVNARAEAMFGYPVGTMVGLPLETLVPERYRVVHDRHRSHFMAHAAARPMGTGMSLVGQRRDGTEFPIEVGLAP